MSDITLFPPPGLTYFFFLNLDADLPDLRRQIRAFAKAGAKALALHPREGMLVPYGGTVWFDFISALVDTCIEEGIQPWLYDEDPYPSGSAGGWLVNEHPEFAMRGIERFEAPADLADGELFTFASGKLLWAGLVSPDLDAGKAVDLTAKVGMIRAHWEAAPWDSRWYYPGVPLHDCPRVSANVPEYAVAKPKLDAGWKLVAFVARPIGAASEWGAICDSLNPAATQAFLSFTHERYKAALGDKLGREVPAIFTDEPKFHTARPYTPGMFESFRDTFGYDLGPRLEHLFQQHDSNDVTLTRVHFLEWCGKRFEESWLKPYAKWCTDNNVALVGHISPEDDPVEQAYSLGNLMPLQKHLSLTGIDLIIPYVGDREYAILNVGGISAASVAQQTGKPGTMSESLGASGEFITAQQAAKVLAWQTLLGVNTIVVHAAFQSTLGLRLHDAGPSYGPDSPRFQGLIDADKALRPFIEAQRDARQIAPVAILWPIRTFMGETLGWIGEDTGRRKAFNDLLMAVLEAQVGVHIIDEAMLVDATFEGGKLAIGKAVYEHVLLPDMSILHADTLAKLRTMHAAGFPVSAMGEQPSLAQSTQAIEPIDTPAWDVIATDRSIDAMRQWCAANLPRLLPIEGDDHLHLRATAWERDGETRTIIMNLSDQAIGFSLAGEAVELAPEQLGMLAEAGDAYTTLASFVCGDVTPNKPFPCAIELCDWQVRFDDEPFAPTDHPQAAYEMRPLVRNMREPVLLMLTGHAAVGADAVANTLEYRANVAVEGDAPVKAVLSLEPTTIRGRVDVSLGDKSWSLTFKDTDTKATTLDLTGLLLPGDNAITFTVHEPTHFDGIKWPPKVYV